MESYFFIFLTVLSFVIEKIFVTTKKEKESDVTQVNSRLE